MGRRKPTRATPKNIRFYALRATGITWRVVRGDRHLEIRQHAGRLHFSTTEKYILDRAYSQCRRALQFLIGDEEDLDRIAPSLRRNGGQRHTPAEPTQETPIASPTPAEAARSAAGTAGAVASVVAAPIGDGAGPFMARQS